MTIWRPGSILTIYIPLQVQLRVPGEAGDPGLHVPRPVVEELRPGGDSVTVQPRTMVVLTVMGRALNRDSATLSFVFQVN